MRYCYTFLRTLVVIVLLASQSALAGEKSAGPTITAHVQGLTDDLVERALRGVRPGTPERARQLVEELKNLNAMVDPRDWTSTLTNIADFANAIAAGKELPTAAGDQLWQSSTGNVRLRVAFDTFKAAEPIKPALPRSPSPAPPAPSATPGLKLEQPQTPTPPKTGLSRAGIATILGGGVALLGALGAEIYVRDRRARIEQGGNGSGLAPLSSDEQSSLWREARTASSVRDGLLIAGGAAVIVGALILVFGSESVGLRADAQGARWSF